ncbi:MAG: EAL domain-containing protein [Janthinobacterium lividum]|nr:EAL domain-containing protein [Janthinobacterium lividum]
MALEAAHMAICDTRIVAGQAIDGTVIWSARTGGPAGPGGARPDTVLRRFSLDHFGSGFSSFDYLKALPVDDLKIDAIFVRGIAGNAINRAMLKAIHEVSHMMGLKTVAQYVENTATLALIRELGIDYAQGYAVGSPRPLAAGVN